MAASHISALESLPLDVLSSICEYVDDDADKRRSLWAFSLASSRCCAASAVQRFCQITLEIAAIDELERSLGRLAKALEPGDCYRHVRRLKFVGTPRQDPRKSLLMQARGYKPAKGGVDRKGGGAGGHGDYHDEDEDEDEDLMMLDDMSSRDYFDVHPFCRPAFGWGAKIKSRAPEWLPLAGLIARLPGLKDFVWDCKSRLPRLVLSVVEARSCRLHMHCFQLPSLIQYRSFPRPIDEDDYALATSPSLFSVVVSLGNFEPGGRINFIEDAVQQMVAGAAPNLAHVWVRLKHAPRGPDREEFMQLGKPTWGGFFPGGAGDTTTTNGRRRTRGSLQSLVSTDFEPRAIVNWGRFTDLRKLRRLSVAWWFESRDELVEAALSGDLASLDTLELTCIEDGSDEVQEPLNQFLGSLPPLRRLHLEGFIRPDTFDIVLRCHGPTLRTLSLQAYPDHDLDHPFFVCTEAAAQQLAARCQQLESLALFINRTRGDARETGVYRALSRLPRLKQAYLQLQYTVGTDPDEWEEEHEWDEEDADMDTGGEEEQHPPARGEEDGHEHPPPADTDADVDVDVVDADDVEFEELRQTFSNCAFDSKLARAIFDMMSAGGTNSLQRLQLEPVPKPEPHDEEGCVYDETFNQLLDWLGRPWLCKRSGGRGGGAPVTVRDLNRGRTEECGRVWQRVSEYPLSFEEEVEFYRDVFKAVWPPKTAEWWNDWESLPLS